MLGWLKSLVHISQEPLLQVEGYRLSPIKLSHPIVTPLGSRVTLVSFCVNVYYSMDDNGNPAIHHVRLWQPDDSVTDILARSNVIATHKGEAWHCTRIEPDTILRFSVDAELALNNSGLRRIMMARWREQNRGKFAESIANSLNNKSTPEQIAKTIAAAGRDREISFTYSKADGTSRIRKVSVASVSGNLLRARDLEDDTLKTFRMDQISNARPL